MHVKLPPIVTFFGLIWIQSGHASNNDSHVIFDQRQTGKYNIHVSIKDVAIIELDRNDFRETNSDPDYYYDDSDFTIKPLLAWYQSLNTTKAPPSTEATTDATTVNLTSIIHTPSTTSSTISEIPSLPENQSVKSSTTSKKPSSVVILGSGNGNSLSPTKSTKSQSPRPIHEAGGEIPVQVVLEPVLHPKFRTSVSHFPYRNVQGRIKPSENSRIFNLRARKALSKDSTKRKVRSSILEKLFGVLASFHGDDDGDE